MRQPVQWLGWYIEASAAEAEAAEYHRRRHEAMNRNG
jgi:hypothetical protein